MQFVLVQEEHIFLTPFFLLKIFGETGLEGQLPQKLLLAK